MAVLVTVLVVLVRVVGVMALVSKVLKTMALPALRDPGSSDRSLVLSHMPLSFFLWPSQHILPQSDGPCSVLISHDPWQTPSWTGMPLLLHLSQPLAQIWVQGHLSQQP